MKRSRPDCGHERREWGRRLDMRGSRASERPRIAWSRLCRWVGFVASAAVALLWLGSHFVRYSYVNAPVDRWVHVSGGNVLLLHAPQMWWSPMKPGHSLRLETSRFALDGVDFSRGATPDIWGVTIPLWLPFLLVACPTVIAWRHRSPAAEGQCINCRYDLTGNRSGRCPECGRAIESARATLADGRGSFSR